jgi:drug/metabolite transporter (DMT)-like permease
LVIGAFIATLVFHETLTWNVIAGAFIVVSAGLFSMFRERSLSLKRTTSSTTP